MTDAPRTLPQRKKLICVDWDGVIHGYQSGWRGALVMPDPPVPGALDWLGALEPTFDIAIYSSRSHEPGAIQAMQQYLIEAYEDLTAERNGEVTPLMRTKINEFVLAVIQWPQHKPPAFITLDDRAVRFQGPGHWPTMDELKNFKTWMGK